MKRKRDPAEVLKLSAIFLLTACALTSSPAEQSIHTDGHRIAPREETSRYYDCGSISATLRYRIERFDDADDDDLTRRVTLVGIAVNGRDLESSEIAAAVTMFRRFGEIDALGSNCVNDVLEIRVFGVTPQELAEYIQRGETPENELHTIRLSARGIVFIR